ncbi:MAG: hypothetical protein ACPL1F_01460 [bacterium]
MFKIDYDKLKKLNNLFFNNKIDFNTFREERLKITKDIYESKEYKRFLLDKVELLYNLYKDKIGLDLNEIKDILFTFAYKESLCNVFEVGDFEISKRYDYHLPKELWCSWGMFQLYSPIHGYIIKDNQRIGHGWVDIERYRKPDISYQISVFFDIFKELYKRYSKKVKNKDDLYYLIARDYNGSGDAAEEYAENWLKLYKDKSYLNFFK